MYRMMLVDVAYMQLMMQKVGLALCFSHFLLNKLSICWIIRMDVAYMWGMYRNLGLAQHRCHRLLKDLAKFSLQLLETILAEVY